METDAKSTTSAAIATAMALAILIALGIWQLQRLHWKENILAQIDRAEAAPPIPLTAQPQPFAKVTATGVLLPATALYGADVRDTLGQQPRIGAQLLAILRRPKQRPLLVALGWVPDGAPPLKPSGVPQTVTGYIRMPDHASFLSADDDVAGRHFYTLNPVAIGAALGEPGLAPYTLIVLGQPAGPDAPVPATELPRPPNNHLQYAFTWFGLAASLVGVFASWVWGKRGR